MGGDAKEIANILIILREMVFTQRPPAKCSVIVGLRIKTCWAVPLILWAILTFLCSKPSWLPVAQILSVFCGFKKHIAPERSYFVLP